MAIGSLSHIFAPANGSMRAAAIMSNCGIIARDFMARLANQGEARMVVVFTTHFSEVTTISVH